MLLRSLPQWLHRRFVLERLIKLPDVRDIDSRFVIDTVKEDAPVPLDHLK